MTRAVLRAGGVRALAVASYAAVLFASAPFWPDDWDGIGFIESVRDFDLAHFHPHPPGYPVYVALLRVAAAVVRDPMRACVLVAVASGVLAVALAWDAARRAAGERAAWLVAILVGVTPAVWHAFSVVGSEAPALACAAACAWGLAAAGPGASKLAGTSSGTVLGLGAGFGLGVRLSWGPLYVAALAIAPRGLRARAWGTAAIACLAWVIPFVAITGPRTLGTLYVNHFAGHAARWGGTIVSDPGMVRAFWLGRDLFFDGLGVGGDPVGLVTETLLVIAAWYALIAWRSTRWRAWREATLIVVPYAVWIALGQNVRDQPRHALPLVALLAAGLALPARRSRGAFRVAGALALATSVRTAADAYARRTIPPPGQQLVDLARTLTLPPNRLIVFGGASVRFFETTDLASRAQSAGSLGDVLMDLTRLDELPARVWVTSELAGLNEAGWPLTPIATLCRPRRLDRRMPCIDVYRWDLPFLPKT